MKLRKATSVLLAASLMAAAVSAMPVLAEGEHYPGFNVVYREGDPQADADVEITSEDEIVWTIASCMEESNPQSVNVARIAEELAEKTDGKFTWDVFYNSELGSEDEAVELCRNNTVQFVTSNVTLMPKYVEAFGVFALPYLFHSEEDILNYLADSDVCKDLYTELEETSNLVTLGFQGTGPRCLSTKGVGVAKTPADLEGVKVRCMSAQVWQDVMEALGATPVPIAYTEVYTALQTGVVQGQDNPAGNTVSSKFHEVLDTYYKTDHVYCISGFYTNPEAWDALPLDYKTLLAGLCQKYLGDQYHEDITAFLVECEGVMKDAGLTIVEKEDMDMEAFYQSAADMIESKYMTDDTYASIINDVNTTFGY